MNSPVPPSVHVSTGYDEGMRMGYMVDTSSQIWKKAPPLYLSNYNKTTILVISKFQLTMEIWSVGILFCSVWLFSFSCLSGLITLCICGALLSMGSCCLLIQQHLQHQATEEPLLILEQLWHTWWRKLMILLSVLYVHFFPFLQNLFFKGRIKSRETGVIFQWIASNIKKTFLTMFMSKALTSKK